MRISERFFRIPVLEPKDWEAGGDGDSINMGKLHSVEFLLAFGAITGDAVLKFYVGATAGTKTTAVAFNYRLSTVDYGTTSADVFGTVTANASTGLTLTAATYDHRLLSIEFDSQAIPDATPFLTMELSAAASVLLASCTATGSGREKANVPAASVI
jgi:hypothetical protein